MHGSPDDLANHTAILGLQLADVCLIRSRDTLLCDLSSEVPNPIMPPTARHPIFHMLHGLSHPGMCSSQQLVGDRFVSQEGHGFLDKELQLVSVEQDCKAQLFPSPRDPCRHQTIQPYPCQPCGFPNPSLGFTHLLTIIDRSTHWLEVIPMHKTIAEVCSDALLHWVSHFGVPCNLTSDHGAQFMSTLWECLTTVWGTKLHRTSSCHPQSNGMVECLHCLLKVSLRTCLTFPAWTKQLPWALLGIHSAVWEDYGCSAVDLIFQHSPLLPMEPFHRQTPQPPSTTPCSPPLCYHLSATSHPASGEFPI